MAFSAKYSNVAHMKPFWLLTREMQYTYIYIRELFHGKLAKYLWVFLFYIICYVIGRSFSEIMFMYIWCNWANFYIFYRFCFYFFCYLYSLYYKNVCMLLSHKIFLLFLSSVDEHASRRSVRFNKKFCMLLFCGSVF